MIAQRTIVADPTKKDQLSVSLLKALAGRHKSSLVDALNSTPHLTAALLRLLAANVSVLCIESAWSFFNDSFHYPFTHI